jgi:release factor glutamine methyltransferase
MTIQQAIELGTQRLAADAHLRYTARRDAELLMMHTASLSRAQLIAYPERELTPEQSSAFEAAIARRVGHEPVQYITGTQEFFGLPFAVSGAVLIPRPETEHLVEAVLERMPRDRVVTIADIGTGSGAIAVALAANLPLAQVTALDLSSEALRIAEANAASNAATHGLTGRIRFLLSDRLTALPLSEQNQYFDAIVSNPPYVPVSDADTLHPQVREHEPSLALYAGADGLDLYRLIIPEARQALRPGGLLALEMGYGQRDALAELLSAWRDVTFVDDLQGVPRIALARN